MLVGGRKKKTQGEHANLATKKKGSVHGELFENAPDHSATLKQTLLLHYLPGLNKDAAFVSRATQL